MTKSREELPIEVLDCVIVVDGEDPHAAMLGRRAVAHQFVEVSAAALRVCLGPRDRGEGRRWRPRNAPSLGVNVCDDCHWGRLVHLSPD